MNSPSNVSQRELVWKQLDNFGYIEGETVEDVIRRFTQLLSEIEKSGLNVTLGRINMAFLYGLPRSKTWDYRVEVIMGTYNHSTMKTKDMISLVN
ncbi:hypothetical protein Hanom_Chr12g01165651 [Helianthus anomalus]